MQQGVPSSSMAGGKEANDVSCSSSTRQSSITLSVNSPSYVPQINGPASDSHRKLSITIPPYRPSCPSDSTSAVTQPERPRSIPSSRNNSPYIDDPSISSTSNRPRSSTPDASNKYNSSRLRRSQRTTALLRGPPELEAAVAIAIRNLESDIYEWWCANYKPGSPLPTAAFLKSRSPRIRRAAEAVDEADRLLNEAINRKPRNSRAVSTSRRARMSQKLASGSDTLPLS